MQIVQLFFHNSILIASRTTDFWCFLKELTGLHRECLSHQRRFSCFCLWYQWIECQRCTVPIKMPKSTRINQITAKKQAARFFRLPALICSSRQRLFPCFFLWCQRIKPPATAIKIRMPTTNATIFQLPSHKLLPIFTVNAIAGNRAIVVRKNNGSGGIVLLKATMYVRASFGKPGHKNNRNTMRSIFRRFFKKENRSRCSSFTKRFKSGRPIHCTR